MLLCTNRSSTSSCDTQHTPSAGCCCTPIGHPPAAVTHNTHHLQDVVVHQQVIHQQLRHTTHTICRMLLYTSRSSTSSCDTQHTPSAGCCCTPTGHPPAAATHNTHHLQDVVVHQQVIHQQLRHTTHTVCRMLLYSVHRCFTSACAISYTRCNRMMVHLVCTIWAQEKSQLFFSLLYPFK